MTDTPNTTQGKGAVDWSRPIEAVHEDGRVVAVHLGGEDENPDLQGDHYTLPSLSGDIPGIWRPDGTSWRNADAGWRIRNVPEHPTPTQYAPELVERMVALLRKQVAKLSGMGDYVTADIAEARSIVSDLPQEVDPDLIEARRIASLFGVEGYSLTAVEDGACDDAPLVAGVRQGIARGRQLAKEDTSAAR